MVCGGGGARNFPSLPYDPSGGSEQMKPARLPIQMVPSKKGPGSAQRSMTDGKRMGGARGPSPSPVAAEVRISGELSS